MEIVYRLLGGVGFEIPSNIADPAMQAILGGWQAELQNMVRGAEQRNSVLEGMNKDLNLKLEEATRQISARLEQANINFTKFEKETLEFKHQQTNKNQEDKSSLGPRKSEGSRKVETKS